MSFNQTLFFILLAFVSPCIGMQDYVVRRKTCHYAEAVYWQSTAYQETQKPANMAATLFKAICESNYETIRLTLAKANTQLHDYATNLLYHTAISGDSRAMGIMLSHFGSTPYIYEHKSCYHTYSDDFMTKSHSTAGPNQYATLLHAAVYHNKVGIIGVLAKHGADLNAQCSDGETALHMAISKESVEMVEALLRNGASAIKKNNAGLSPLDLAHKMNAFQIIELFKTIKNDAPIYYTHQLFQSSVTGNIQQLRACLQARGNVNIKDTAGNTPLAHAVANRHAEIIQELLTYGANPSLKNKDGIDPIHLALQHNQFDILKIFHHAATPMPIVNRKLSIEHLNKLIESIYNHDAQLTKFRAIKKDLSTRYGLCALLRIGHIAAWFTTIIVLRALPYFHQSGLTLACQKSIWLFTAASLFTSYSCFLSIINTMNSVIGDTQDMRWGLADGKKQIRIELDKLPNIIRKQADRQWASSYISNILTDKDTSREPLKTRDCTELLNNCKNKLMGAR